MVCGKPQLLARVKCSLMVNFLLFKIILYLASCIDLYDPDSGTVSVSGVNVSDTAQYSCNYGYNISGSSLLTCLPNRTWDNLPPTCVKGIIYCSIFVKWSETENLFAQTTVFQTRVRMVASAPVKLTIIHASVLLTIMDTTANSMLQQRPLK